MANLKTQEFVPALVPTNIPNNWSESQQPGKYAAVKVNSDFEYYGWGFKSGFFLIYEIDKSPENGDFIIYHKTGLPQDLELASLFIISATGDYVIYKPQGDLKYSQLEFEARFTVIGSCHYGIVSLLNMAGAR